MPRTRKKASQTGDAARAYRYPESDLAARPEIGAQAHFKQAKPPTTWRFNSSLAPELHWDGQNPAREIAEQLIEQLADDGIRAAELAAQPASKERDTEISNLKARIADDLFGFQERPLADQVLKAYEHRDRWVNRLLTATFDYCEINPVGTRS